MSSTQHYLQKTNGVRRYATGSRINAGFPPFCFHIGNKNISPITWQHFYNFTVLPEIAVAKIREDAPFDKVCYIGCGVTTGIGAVIYTAKVTPGATVIVFGLGGIGLKCGGADARGKNYQVLLSSKPLLKILV